MKAEREQNHGADQQGVQHEHDEATAQWNRRCGPVPQRVKRPQAHRRPVARAEARQEGAQDV